MFLDDVISCLMTYRRLMYEYSIKHHISSEASKELLSTLTELIDIIEQYNEERK